MAGAVALGIGLVLLLVGIIGGFSTTGERHTFSWWLTVAGVGFTIAGIVLLTS